MSWIDCKKSNDMTPQIWILEAPKMFKFSDPIVKSKTKSMENWSVVQATGRQTVANIFLDLFFRLLSVITMIPLNSRQRQCKGDYKFIVLEKDNPSHVNGLY